MRGAAWILLAAGSSTRFGAGGNKLLEPLGDGRVIDRTIASLRHALPEAPIILVSRPELRDVLDWTGPWTEGGRRRQDSAARGLEAAGSLSPAPGVALIHDAARPFVSRELVQRLLASLDADAAAAAVAPSLPVTDTIKRVRGENVVETLERSSLVALQTPQALRMEVAGKPYALMASGEREQTDDLAVLEASGLQTRVSRGDAANIKITTRDDLARAAALLHEWTG